MNELKMIKAFAKLEGVNVVHSPIEIDSTAFPVTFFTLKDNGYEHEEYNPVSDLALNCRARDEYRVSVDHYEMDVSIINERMFAVKFKSKEELKRAVIECILRSKGLWEV